MSSQSNFQDFSWKFSSLEVQREHVQTEKDGKGVVNSLINLSVGKTLGKSRVWSCLQLPHPIFYQHNEPGLKLDFSSENVKFAGIRWQLLTLEYGAIPLDLQSPSPYSLED